MRTTPRSWLFVPGDSEKKLLKTPETGAHALIVDLEDAVAPSAKPAARRMTRDWLEAHKRQITMRKQARWVRINAVETGLWREDLAAVMAGAPEESCCPRLRGPSRSARLRPRFMSSSSGTASQRSDAASPARQRNTPRGANHHRLHGCFDAEAGRSDMGCRRPLCRTSVPHASAMPRAVDQRIPFRSGADPACRSGPRSLGD